MSDYGHEVLFGSFLTPAHGDAQQAVELAQLSEQIGLDLATFQDHPYQARFLDTWTLLSFVAASTSTIHLSANVTNLPLRPPAVLARSVASLDLLSGGRIELGLGAGAYWEAIEAMGGPRRTPGESVEALEEAIEVIRQVWDGTARGGVRVDGAHYRVLGAKRGPAPAHEVGIWLGAYKPRMLALTGRRADGWLPSLSYLEPGDLSAANAIIDESALEAGRAPREIRRLLNVSGQFLPTGRSLLEGPAEQWAEELAEMALTDGVSTFILASDDPDDLRRFAAEVAPVVRELVGYERSTAATSAPSSPAAAAGSTARTASRASTAPTAPTAPSVSVSSPVARGPFSLVPTPDDGSRRSHVTVWDESTRPSGPPQDPHRTYTAQEQATGQQLIDVHDALRGELARLQDLIEQVAAGALDASSARSHINTMTMRQNNWVLGTYCESFCRILTTHHTLEDQAMFPNLRGADSGLSSVIDRLEYEHHAIHEVLEAIDRALVAFVAPPGGMADLRAAVDLLSDALLSHLAYEERELVEPLSRFGLG